MSTFVPNKVYLWGILLHYFISNKSAPEAHRILVETYGGNALSDTTCRDWFRRLKIMILNLRLNNILVHRKNLKAKKESEEVLDGDRSQTPAELGKHYELTSQLFRNV